MSASTSSRRRIMTIGHNALTLASALILLLMPMQMLVPVDAFKIPVFFDSTNGLHRDMQYHPEQAARIELCVSTLEQQIPDKVELYDVAPEAHSQQPLSESAKPWYFTGDELAHARDMLVKAHSEEMVAGLEQRCHNSRQQRIEEGRDALGFVGYVDADTYLTTETYDVCLRATASWIRAVDESTSVNNPIQTAFAMTRPPGHHATPSLSNGFCLFNFAGAATIHYLEQHPEAKVSILDWDVHYGQGVAKIIRQHDRARYVSIHQSPAFPYMANRKRIMGDHANVLTLPIPAESTWTCGYHTVLKDDALPFLRTTGEWEPDLVIVCAGYDALSADELASVNLNAKDYGAIVEALMDHLDDGQSATSITLGLEGGYQLKHAPTTGNLADAVVETLESLHRRLGPPPDQ